MWDKDYSKNKKCINCGALIINRAIRCQKCAYKGELHYLFGKHPSKTTKLKMSKAGRGKVFTEEHKENMKKAFKNRIISIETRQKISNTLKGRSLVDVNHKPKCPCSFCRAHRKELTKESNPNWRGGLSFEPYSLEWTKELKYLIRKRDDFTCQNPKCNYTQQKNSKVLDVHHIDYIKKNIKEENLISLCHFCHMKTNWNRDYWYAYYTYIMEGKCLS